MRPKLIDIPDGYMLKRCVEMATSELSRGSGVTMLKFDKERKMTLKKYKEIAMKQNSEPHDHYDSTEAKFWQQLKKSGSKSQLTYAIDNEITRYPDDFESWNLNKLTNIESIIHNADGPQIPGVNSPYLNYGMKFCSFAMHCEDSYVGSINTLHEGEPRTWYTVPQSNAAQLENLVQNWTPRSIACDLFIRHKSVLIPPEILQLHGIQYGQVK